MKKFVLIIAVCAFISCIGRNNTSKTDNQVGDKSAVIETQDTALKEATLFLEFRKLYRELLDFKDKQDFIQYGFSTASPYNDWLNKVQSLIDDKDSKLLAQKGVLAEELKQLGFLYVSSGGKENDRTRFFNEAFDKAINPPVKQSTASKHSLYDKAKAENELFGKWRIVNTPASINYVYEVYKNGNEYVGFILDKELTIEHLERKGDKYYLKDSDVGEYYLIDANKNMTLYDKGGSLADVGYRAMKM